METAIELFVWGLAGIGAFVVILFIISIVSKRGTIIKNKYDSFSIPYHYNCRCEPMRLTCEHKGCFSQDVEEYERKEDGRDWEGEPIALCKDHSTGYTHHSKILH